MFPGLRSHLGTLRANFYWPLVRHWYLALGLVNVSVDSIDYILTRKGHGNITAIVVGGAREALETSPGGANLVLKDRKGFVKRAIATSPDAESITQQRMASNDTSASYTNP